MMSDSAYVVGLFSGIVMAPLTTQKHMVMNFVQQLHAILQKCSETIFILHFQYHSGPPGLMAQGKEIFDQLVVPVFT